LYSNLPDVQRKNITEAQKQVKPESKLLEIGSVGTGRDLSLLTNANLKVPEITIASSFRNNFILANKPLLLKANMLIN
jgi:hypothetical protein